MRWAPSDRLAGHGTDQIPGSDADGQRGDHQSDDQPSAPAPGNLGAGGSLRVERSRIVRPRVSREGVVRDGWLDTGDLGHVDAGGFVFLTGRAKDLIIRGGHNIDPKVIEDALLAHPAVAAAAAVGRPDRHSGEVPVAYVVPADPGRFDEANLLAWAGTAIDEPAARPKRIYPVDVIPVTEVGKPFKPALAADAAIRVVTDALAAAGLADPQVTAAHEDGRLVVTVTGADPDRVRDAVAGFALTVRCGPSPASKTAAQ